MLLLIVTVVCAKLLQAGSQPYGMHFVDDRDSITDSMIQRSEEYYDYGIRNAKSEHFFEALELLRGAVRNDPYNLNYLNDLGVTEMRMGDLDKAKRRFWRCLTLEPEHVDCKKNAEEVHRFQGDEEYYKGSSFPRPQLHNISPVPEISEKKLSKLKLESEEGKAILSKPFVVRGALQKWGWSLFSYSAHELAHPEAFGKSTVEFYPHGMRDEAVHPFFAGLSESFEWLHNPVGTYTAVDASEEGSYIQWNLLSDQFERMMGHSGAKQPLPKAFNDKWWKDDCLAAHEVGFDIAVHWNLMLIGERHAGMFNHKDYLPTASFQIQLEGEKKWHLCAPDQDEFMYNAGDVDTFFPDYDTFPKFRDATCLQTTLEAGDVIYYPEDYWHQTLNLVTTSTALSKSIIRSTNYEGVQQRLREECAGAGAIFAPNEAMCNQLEKCFERWDDEFTSMSKGKSSKSSKSRIKGKAKPSGRIEGEL